MPHDTEKTAFLDDVRARLADGSFLKLTLGKYRGAGEDRRCVVSRVDLKGEPHVRFITHRGTQDITENHGVEAALDMLAKLIGVDYLSAVLFSSRADLTLVYSRKRVGRLSRGKPTLSSPPPVEHDRRKAYLVDAAAAYLARLGVTTADGEVKPSMYGKFRQICRFVEIIDQLLAVSELADAPAPAIVDVGAGKGYLTFALHEHLSKRLGKTPRTRGIEANAGLVATCNAIAAECGIAALSFEAGRIENRGLQPASGSAEGDGAKLDILIALHACDTATDDAMHLGIAAGAAIIVCAPCCQHEVAPQLETSATPLAGLLKFGLLRQRQADLFTDAARALLLEAHGYEVRVIELVSTEHTAKNLLIAAVRSPHVDREAALAQYERLAALAGFEHQRLQQALAGG